MLIGTVIGNVWATKKNEQLSGCKLMIIEPLRYENHSASAPLVAVDAIGAASGSRCSSFPAAPPVSASGTALPPSTT